MLFDLTLISLSMSQINKFSFSSFNCALRYKICFCVCYKSQIKMTFALKEHLLQISDQDDSCIERTSVINLRSRQLLRRKNICYKSQIKTTLASKERLLQISDQDNSCVERTSATNFRSRQLLRRKNICYKSQIKTTLASKERLLQTSDQDDSCVETLHKLSRP
jgi:Rps23 Pro-64 3,4-dihydroxylase Tpa1-like proline 4-hydroxylase